ncbi:hypothetical protein QP179_02000 [Sphingomonas aurantiaca]|uniref:hypothetical protein n=1 Tax=Sphingomonas aurantiaca TaxID=185949 RepID=UPI002FE4007B
MVARIDPTAGKHQCAAGEHHRLCPLDEQQLGRSGGGIAEQHERRGGDCWREGRTIGHVAV